MDQRLNSKTAREKSHLLHVNFYLLIVNYNFTIFEHCFDIAPRALSINKNVNLQIRCQLISESHEKYMKLDQWFYRLWSNVLQSNQQVDLIEIFEQQCRKSKALNACGIPLHCDFGSLQVPLQMLLLQMWLYYHN